MALYSIPLRTAWFTISILTLLIKSSTTTRASAEICYKSIISFGDSLADTGNLVRLSPSINNPPPFFRPPYGESFFHHPTGRCSDGRLIIDFTAESFGLPFVPPYLAGKGEKEIDFRAGVNFAVAGATALDFSVLQEIGVYNPLTNASLGTQLGWFKDILPSFCSNSSDCGAFLKSSLILMGEIGGNDYNYALLDHGKKIKDVKSFAPAVVRQISSAIKELIELGAVSLMVPGNLPIGCSAAYLTYYQSSNKHDYDMAGCIKWLNNFSEYHNKLLQIELNRIRALHPHATIIYADYYNAAMRLYTSPNKYGFRGGALTACCGAGGPYNYNSSAECGLPPSTSCDDPSLYVSWDGLHLTEAAYRLIAQGILEGPYSTPPINTICTLASASSGLLHQD